MQRKPRTCATARAAPRRSTAAARWLAVLALSVLTGLAQAQPAGSGARAPARAPAQEPVTLNFVNAEVEAVTRAIGQIMDRQFILDPRVRGQVTITSEKPVRPREAYWQYLAALRFLGFTVVETDGIFKVVPEADAKLQSGPVVAEGGTVRGDQIITQIFRLNHENAGTLVGVLRPLISPNNTINVTPGTNALVITDYAENLRRIGRIIAALDLPAASDLEVIPLQHAIASDIAALVQRLVDGSAGAQAAAAQGGAPGGGTGVTVLSDARSNALIVRAANPARMHLVRSVIEKLDRPASGPAAGNVHVVYLKNADARRLADILRAAISGEGAGGGTGGGRSPLMAATAAASGTTTATSGTSPSATGGLAGGGAAAGLSTGTGAALGGSSPPGPTSGGNIQADPATNSLIITAPEPQYRQLRAIIDQLDSRRAQVYVEALIAEVRADKAADIGFQWQTALGREGNRYIGGVGTNFGARGNNILDLTVGVVTDNIPGAPGPGFNIGLLRRFGDAYGIAALARFLETNGDANILSTPNLVTLDNEEARIVIAQNVPFVTGQFTNTGAGGGGQVNPFQTIERQDVGLTLRVRPQIGEGGTIKMVIYQEASSVAESSVQAGVSSSNLGVVTNKRTIESTVLVEDGQIIVLGGLLQDEYAGTIEKVPGLGDVPILGHLFRSESRTRRKTNLMVFLRPVVMRSPEQTQALTMDRYDVIRALQRGAQPAPHALMPVTEAPVLPVLGAAPSLYPPPSAERPNRRARPSDTPLDAFYNLP